ncbi:hypothetical protein GTO91_09700 [Heliobacterium undosum]|uniref:Uncharacterized protein n=1 Tax=Heliomicrobium undosum TaxID=121734 RepID=A0A845L0K0_9FIRM|nr:hypothetical protein [Heliomicrobium undosum]MZP29977.1 hypothetical protein [Heliomicrobium undosum]
MSHFTQILSQSVTNMEALRKAVARMGFELRENDLCRYYFGRKQKDFVIRLPGKYDAALVPAEEGAGGYRIEADWEGDHVSRYLGREAELLLKYYTAELAKIEALKRGYAVSEQAEEGALVVLARDSDGSALRIECHGGGSIRCQPQHITGEACMKFFELEQALGDIQEHQKTGAFWGSDETLKKLRVRGRYFCG